MLIQPSADNNELTVSNFIFVTTLLMPSDGNHSLVLHVTFALVYPSQKLMFGQNKRDEFM